MRIGLFLDVDITLTKGLIQRHYAEKIGALELYQEIEKSLQNQIISSEEFGDRLISLFNDSNFSDEIAETWFPHMPLQSYADSLLQLPKEHPVEIYLVSSGPSYYVKRLAEKYSIPESNVLCSKYIFEDIHGGKLSHCEAVSQYTKSHFVNDKRKKHSITIGVGDHLTFDGPFISLCDIPILTSQNDSYLSVEKLEVLPNLIKTLAKKITLLPRTKPSVFIGSASEQKTFCNIIQSSLYDICDSQIWNQGFFSPGDITIESLEKGLNRFDFAIFFTTPNDLVTIREENHLVVRDNIIFELGLFIAKLGRERCFLLAPSDKKFKLPSDLNGLTILRYRTEALQNNVIPEEIHKYKAAFYESIETIISQIKKLGCIQYRNF